MHQVFKKKNDSDDGTIDSVEEMVEYEEKIMGTKSNGGVKSQQCRETQKNELVC